MQEAAVGYEQWKRRDRKRRDRKGEMEKKRMKQESGLFNC